MENDRSEVIQLKNKIENYFEKGKIPPSEKNLYTKFFTLYLYLKKENFLQINDKESCISYYAESEGLLKELKNIGILLETLSPELFFETFKKNHDEIDLFINKSKHERIELVRLFFNNDLFQFEYKQHKAEFLAFKAQMDRYHTINDSGLKKNYLNIIALRLDPVVGFYRKVHTLHIKSKEVQEFLQDIEEQVNKLISMDIDLEKNFEIALNDPIYFWSDFAHSSSGKLFTIASFIEKFAFVISFCIILLLFWMC